MRVQQIESRTMPEVHSGSRTNSVSVTDSLTERSAHAKQPEIMFPKHEFIHSSRLTYLIIICQQPSHVS